MSEQRSEYDGLAIDDILPVDWNVREITQPASLEHANEDTARALQAIAVYEETPRAPKDDLVHMPSESSRVEAKVDLILSLLSNIVSEQVGMPEPRALILRNGSIEWQLKSDTEVARGDAGIASVWINTHLPLPLRLPCRVDGTVQRNGFPWAQARFEFLAPNVRDSLGQVIFRHHRRQVAIARGTITSAKRDFM